MSDYISRKAFLADVEKRFCTPCKMQGSGMIGIRCRACWVDGLLGEVQDAPAVDAVPVVRCKDCKYYKPDEFEYGCDFAGGLPYVKADDFCSFGQRRDQFAGSGNMDGGSNERP